MSTISTEDLDRVATGSHYSPHSVLGHHPATDASGSPATRIRVRRPLARTVTALLADGTRVDLEHERHGVWAGLHGSDPQPYRIEATYDEGPDWIADDPYRFLPTVGELDLHLMSEGRHEELWRVLGSHLRTIDGVDGTAFAVWAPNAQAVRLVGDVNGWDGQGHPMRSLGSTGVWELFVPGVGEGSAYKYEILTRSGHWIMKADPMARAAEVPPATASVVTKARHQWQDADWMARRAKTSPVDQPMSIYEVHL